MAKEILGIRHILGLKVKDLRTSKNLSYLDLSKETGLSVSYLSEIEKGKKYPKGDKILSLAKALGVDYDYLVSLKVSKKLEPIVDLVNSDFFKDFPLELFGMEAQKVIEILSVAPEKLNAFVKSIQQIARNYEMNNEQFYQAALRSYQEINGNYFSEIENKVSQFKDEFGIDTAPTSKDELVEILKSYFNISVDFESLGGETILKHVRSHYNSKNKILKINNGLTTAQETFLLGRELAFAYLELKNRPLETPPQTNYSFESLLNNYKASYFSAALIIEEGALIKDVRQLSGLEKWDSNFLPELLKKYNATPEMLMQRLTNLLPRHFNLKNLFFLRFVGRPDKDYYKLSKELHLNKIHSPHTNEINEHYCRRWMALKIMDRVKDKVEKNEDVVLSEAQISNYWQTDQEYLVLTLSFPNASKHEYVISISIGFQIDNQLKSNVNFLKDPQVPNLTVHTTCERCNVSDCLERKSPPFVYNQEQRSIAVNRALEKM